MKKLTRRSFLKKTQGFSALALSSVPLNAWEVLAQTLSTPSSSRGEPEPFSFASLQNLARQRAQAPYQPPLRPVPAVVARLGYEEWGEVLFDPQQALFREGPGKFPITLFPLGAYFPTPVRIYEVQTQGQTQIAREVLYSSQFFHIPPHSFAQQLPPDAGFSGFRVHTDRQDSQEWQYHDWVAFLGASYFRAIGDLDQYGLSARGIAINTAVEGETEEFPDFTRFYLGPETEKGLLVQALLEGPSITGAYQFLLTPQQGVTMEVKAFLFLRQDVKRLGLAPCTSMYWFSEKDKEKGEDWRPEVHDSDGLALWTGKGEQIWRPLNNPPYLHVSAFQDENPRGYGLLQRDRQFDHYLDGVFYDRRPSLWVEPLNDWGRGAVQLVEIPTREETSDNSVAFWVPAQPAKAGQTFELHYKLYWSSQPPEGEDLARCVATRLGLGGQVGRPAADHIIRKFVVEFKGENLKSIPPDIRPTALLWSSRGFFIDYRLTEPVPTSTPDHWRTQFSLDGVVGSDPVELRCLLHLDGRPLTETWLFQYFPF